ncbi:MAG: hypothetical protein MRQ07_03880 [Candidatus Midichloria sp.]|nr:hypothetical protein [Candidatus Midichloria sp.]
MTPAAAGSGVSGDIGYPHERREIHNRKRPVVDDKDFGKRASKVSALTKVLTTFKFVGA